MKEDATDLPLAMEVRSLLGRIGQATALPPIVELLLPPVERETVKQDEFGFVVLADGSIGPFYCNLADTLGRLHRWLSLNPIDRLDTLATALWFGHQQLHRSALGLGAYNAISQHLMRRAGFDPVAAERENPAAQPQGRIGMVGYFGPLIERYLARGLSVTVIEQRPERVPPELGLAVSTGPGALAECDYVVCTASTLINNTLDEILANLRPGAAVNLMGPSASCLPDLLFSRGVAVVGGLVIDDPGRLRSALANGEPWGASGRKYQLTAAGYPGLARLLARLAWLR